MGNVCRIAYYSTFAPRSHAVKNKLWSLVTVQVWHKTFYNE